MEEGEGGVELWRGLDDQSLLGGRRCWLSIADEPVPTE